MRENPLGTPGTAKLLSAVNGGAIKHLDIFNCGFVIKYNAGYKIFNPKDPDGQYQLDLSKPPDYQVALELMRAAQKQGSKSWKKPILNKKKFNVDGLDKDTFPTAGERSNLLSHPIQLPVVLATLSSDDGRQTRLQVVLLPSFSSVHAFMHSQASWCSNLYPSPRRPTSR